MKNQYLLNLLFLFLFLFLNFPVFSQGISGNLVIVGGGLEADNKAVFNELINLSGGKDKAVIAVVPSASGLAVQSFESFKNILKSYGVPEKNIHLIRIASVDDDSTLNEDESSWKNNGNSSLYADIILKSSCVWFTGGDQLRTVRTLYNPDGTPTLVLSAIWEVYKNGGVIGGTSAGAAIMSDPIIADGNSIGALTHGVKKLNGNDDFSESDGVLITRGIGFFPHGIVDQHFHARARIARLVMAVFSGEHPSKIGYGVDENTAMIYNAGNKTVKAAGVGGITIVDITDARLKYAGNFPVIDSVTVHFLQQDDIYEITSGTIIPSAERKQINGTEYYNDASEYQSGVLSGASENIVSLLTIKLVDNKNAAVAKSISFINNTIAYETRLQKTTKTRAYISDNNGEDRYTVSHVLLSLTPVKVKIETIK